MRDPSEQEPGVVVILDRLPELKVVHDAIVDGTVNDYYARPALGEYQKHAGYRFNAEAREARIEEAPNGPYLMPEEWKVKPEFRVLKSDAEFVMAAAYKTLQKRSWSDFLKNVLTGRDKAASDIISCLTPTVLE